MAEERLQRRLAAILSADVVGYSRLMGLDEAGTLSRLNALRRELIDPTIAAHAGRIVKLMGDGALVEFASAVDAVTCAIEIQRQLREHDASGSEANPIQFRIGINVGDIIMQHFMSTQRSSTSARPLKNTAARHRPGRCRWKRTSSARRRPDIE